MPDDSEYCKNCGELMAGSGYTESIHCRHVKLEMRDLREGFVEYPIYCQDESLELHRLREPTQ